LENRLNRRKNVIMWGPLGAKRVPINIPANPF